MQKAQYLSHTGYRVPAACSAQAAESGLNLPSGHKEMQASLLPGAENQHPFPQDAVVCGSSEHREKVLMETDFKLLLSLYRSYITVHSFYTLPSPHLIVLETAIDDKIEPEKGVREPCFPG